MQRMAALLAGLGLLAGAGAVGAQQVVYSNFLASDGFYPDPADSQVLTDDGADPVTGLETNVVVAVPFTVPPGLQYCVDHVEVEVSQAAGSQDMKLEVMIGNSPGSWFFQAAAANLTEYAHVVSIPVSTVLAAGATYYLHLAVKEPTLGSGSAVWYANNAGIQDAAYVNARDGAGFSPSFGQIPVFRILGAPCPPPAVAPAYAAFSTLGQGPAAVVEVRMEVSCPGAAQPLFVCPVSIQASANATSAQVCQLLADGINRHGYACWFPAGAPDPAEPNAFRADCNGNNLRLANFATGLCSGAFVAADVVEDLAPPGAKRTARFGSYEADSIGGALQLELSGAVSGVAANPALPDGISVVYRGISSGQIFMAEVPIDATMDPAKIGALLGQALLEDRAVSATAKGIRIQPLEPYDLTVNVNDSALHWALSPYPDLLEQSANHPPALLPSCSSTSTQLCLHHNRFQVRTSWRTPQGTTGVGTASQTSDDSGSFAFFNGNNLELVAKVVDACGLVQKFWFFVSGLTNVGVDVTVTDTVTGQTRTYHNTTGTTFQPILDTAAFTGCS